MVSDVIAYPERVTQLINDWCAGGWADHLVVTMKFQGAPDWVALGAACEVGRSHGYNVRVKHFFANKNEVSMMLRRFATDTLIAVE